MNCPRATQGYRRIRLKNSSLMPVFGDIFEYFYQTKGDCWIRKKGPRSSLRPNLYPPTSRGSSSGSSNLATSLYLAHKARDIGEVVLAETMNEAKKSHDLVFGALAEKLETPIGMLRIISVHLHLR